MSGITADRVKELRESSGAGIMDCKRALAATGGDLQKSIEFLRKEGVLKAAKKVGRATLEGLIGIGISKGTAALVEVNCETDFVARTDNFQNFLAALAETILRDKPKGLHQLQTLKLGHQSVAEALAQLIARVGENMSVRRFGLLEAGPGEVIGSYLHAGAKIGAIVRIRGEGVNEALARDIAMHVAAMTPHYIDRKQVPEAILIREKEILRATPEINAKPENLRDKIIDGKLNRYYAENCLLEQPFVKDPSGKKNVGSFLRDQAPKAEVVQIARFQVGEEGVS